MESQQKIGL